ncbi:MAG: RNA polymerase sigma factor [Clostridia bacterium]|nr:RNA polymerase sigma factor [Clostridia bacterium]
MNDVTETFNSVYDATFRELMRCCLLKVPVEDAGDLLQNTYAQFYRLLLKKGSGAIREPKAYLLTVLKHEIAGYYRFRARRKELPLTTAEKEPDSVSVEELSLDRAAIGEVLDRLREAPERTQRMFLLYYGYGMKLGDIAKEMGTTEAGVKSRLLRVRKKLRTSFGEENHQ